MLSVAINSVNWKLVVTADRDARRSDGSDKDEAVRQQGITEC